MDLGEWDREVGSHLAAIRLNAGWIKSYSEGIERHLAHMQVKPDFATEAEARITEVIPDLEHSLALLKLCRDNFRALQVETN